MRLRIGRIDLANEATAAKRKPNRLMVEADNGPGQAKKTPTWSAFSRCAGNK